MIIKEENEALVHKNRPVILEDTTIKEETEEPEGSTRDSTVYVPVAECSDVKEEISELDTDDPLNVKGKPYLLLLPL